MLIKAAERENQDTFIDEKKISMETVSTSPFERLGDIVMRGDFASIQSGKLDFLSKNFVSSTVTNDPSKEEYKENRIGYASRDLSKLPDNPYLMNNLGKALLNNGNLDGAIDLFERAVKVKPDFQNAFLNLAVAYEINGKNDNAIKIYNDLLTTDDRNTKALVNIGNIHLKNNNINEAKEIFEKILKIDENNVAALDRLSIINLVQGHHGKSINYLRKCILLETNLPAVYNNLGVAYAASKLLKNAIESFRISLKLSPNFINAVINLATALNQEGKREEGIELLEDYLRNNENVGARELLSKLYMGNKKPLKALSQLNQALTYARSNKFQPKEIARLLNNIGVIYHKTADITNAQKYYLESLEENGYGHHALLANLLELNFELNKLDKVKEYVEILKEKFPKVNLHQYYEGKLFIRQGEIEKGIELLILSIKENENFKLAYTLLGFVLAEVFKQYDEAIKINEIAIKKFPKDITTINNLAYFCLMNNEIDRARVVLETAQGIIDKGPYLNATIGLLKIKEGNIEEGSRFYNTARDLSPNVTFAKMVEQKKNLEIGRYFLNLGEKDKSIDYFRKVLTFRVEENQFSKEALTLYNEIQNIKVGINRLDKRGYDEIFNKIFELRSLEDNWDSYGSAKISEKAVNNARLFVEMMAQKEIFLREPIVMPEPGGGVLLKWKEVGNKEFLAWFSSDGVLSYMIHRAGQREEFQAKSLEILLNAFCEWLKHGSGRKDS